MRRLLVLLLLAPTALAQAELVDWVVAQIDPFEAPIPPLQRAETTSMTTRASCLLADGAMRGDIPLRYVVREHPAWATVVVSPSTDVAPLGDCAGGYAQPREAQILASLTDQAPAFAPAPIVVEVVAGSGQRQQTELATVNVTASYFGLLDVQLAEAITVVAPGRSHEFRATVTNFGNGRTRVETTLAQPPERLDVALPPPLTLGSKQQGATDVSAELAFRVSAPPETGLVNRVTTFHVAISSAYDTDDSFPGDDSALSFVVTVRSGAGDGSGSPVPDVGPIAALGVLAAVAGLLRRPLRP